MRSRKRSLELFWVFFKIGLFTFGGGYAMIAMIEEELNEKRGWTSGDELSEVFAIAESTPGPIAVNCATYVGYKRSGASGAACATLGVVTPSFLIIYAISLFIERFMALTVVEHAFRGILVAVAILILRAGLRLARGLKRRPWVIATSVLSALAIIGINGLGWRISTIWLILAGAVAGVLANRGSLMEGGGRR